MRTKAFITHCFSGRQYWEMYLIKISTNIHVHLTVAIFNINKYKNVPQVVIEFLTCFKKKSLKIPKGNQIN